MCRTKNADHLPGIAQEIGRMGQFLHAIRVQATFAYYVNLGILAHISVYQFRVND